MGYTGSYKSRDSGYFWLGALLCLPFTGWGINVALKHITFDRECGGYLVRASNANTVPLAKTEMERAIKYLEANNLTSGYTSIVYNTPDEDIGFWYQNLKASYQELSDLSAKSDLTSLEQSNTLLKLRDTLTDHQDGKESLTRPQGLAVYPNNTSTALFGALSIIAGLVGCIMIGIAVKD